MKEQIMEYASGNEMAAIAIKQIGYDLMGYYPITPSTQIAENLDAMKANGETDLVMIAAEGEHSAAGICYGASVAGGRVVNATSANGLMYALEQFPVQSGTRYPMVMNVACRTISGPLSIKGDHSDIMYLLNAGWPILFASTVQEVYDFNVIALKLAEAVRLPVVVAYDGFFTSHQKARVYRFAEDEVVREFIGPKKEEHPFLDIEHGITVGSYMNEPDLINNRYQLHLAMKEAYELLPKLFAEYKNLSGREYGMVEAGGMGDDNFKVDSVLALLGSSYDTAKEAIHMLRDKGEKVGAFTLHVLRPFPEREVWEVLKKAKHIVVADRQDSYGANGGNLSMEIRACMQKHGYQGEIKNLVYGLGGKDFYLEDAEKMLHWGRDKDGDFMYYGVTSGEKEEQGTDEGLLFPPITGESTKRMEKLNLNQATAMPARIAPGHGACPGCGIPVNLNLLLRAIEDPVVLLFQTGCGMIVTTPYPKTAFRVPYLHNLFQNGAATLSGVAEVCYRKQQKGEIPAGDIVFIMVSGDGGMDIGMGSALGTALRGHRMIIFEYDNGGYMNTGYQLSYSTPLGAKSATSHVGKEQYGKNFFHKDMPRIMAATGIPYVATVAESNPMDFMNKAKKASEYAKHKGLAYIKAISACPLNWNDAPATERKVIEAAVDACYFPLYEIEEGVVKLSYDPTKLGKKIPVIEWLSMMGRTKHLKKEEYKEIVESFQQEVDKRFLRIKTEAERL